MVMLRVYAPWVTEVGHLDPLEMTDDNVWTLELAENSDNHQSPQELHSVVWNLVYGILSRPRFRAVYTLVPICLPSIVFQRLFHLLIFHDFIFIFLYIMSVNVCNSRMARERVGQDGESSPEFSLKNFSFWEKIQGFWFERKT